MAKLSTKRTVSGSALKVIHLVDIKVDPSYQRDAVDRAWKKIMADFNPQALGVPVLGERDDGTLWVVDGLQRITALKKMNKKEVRAEVFASKGPEHEAEVFKLINKNRTGLKPLQMFHAMLTAQDKSAWDIKRIAEEYDFIIPKHTKASPSGGTSNETRAKQLGSIVAVQKIYGWGGEQALRFVLKVISQCWADDDQRTRDTIMFGLYRFWDRQEASVDIERLVPRLNTTTPAKIIYSANAMAGDRSANASDIFLRLYRKRLKKD